MKIICSILALSILFSPLAVAGKNGGKSGKKHHHGIAKLDTNHDKQVSLEEFKASKRGQKKPDKAEAIFKKIDTNGDGQISKDEFKSAKKAHHHKGKGKKAKGAKKGKKGRKAK